MSSFWRIHTTYILVIGLVLLAIVTAVAFALNTFEQRYDVRLGSTVYTARLADDSEERQQGLSGVTNLGRNDALLMEFEIEDRWGIWMKDMKIPLDIVWLDKDKKVIYIVQNARPELSTSQTFQPDDPARYVLEIPAGSVEADAIKLGDTAAFELAVKGTE